MILSVSLHHAFPGFTLDAAFDAPPGVTALFGRSGSGKTTIVNAVAGLLRPKAGRVALGDDVLLDTAADLCLPPHRRRLGYVFQEDRLFPHLTVAGNLDYGRRFSGSPPTPSETARVVELLDISDLLPRRPGALSGGEKQRVAIGRALLSRPRMLLMDEPLASLDAGRKEDILPYLERLRDEAALPILYVSHAIGEVARLATTLVLMERGRVLRAGPVAELLSDPATAAHLGPGEAGAVVEARVAAHHGDGLSELTASAGTLWLPRVSAAPGEALRIRILASDVMLALDPPSRISALNVLPVTVAEITRGRAGGAMVRLAAGRDHLLARLTARSAEALGLTPGTTCHAIIKSVAVTRGDVGTGHAVTSAPGG